MCAAYSLPHEYKTCWLLFNLIAALHQKLQTLFLGWHISRTTQNGGDGNPTKKITHNGSINDIYLTSSNQHFVLIK